MEETTQTIAPTAAKETTAPTHRIEQCLSPIGAACDRWLADEDPEEVVKGLICLIAQTCSQLDRRIGQMERRLEQAGRTGATNPSRGTRDQRAPNGNGDTGASEPAFQNPPACPKCGRPMALRVAQKGNHPGSKFWGCTTFPDCDGTLPLRGRKSTRSEAGNG